MANNMLCFIVNDSSAVQNLRLQLRYNTIGLKSGRLLAVILCLPKRCIPTATATTAGGTALQLLTTDFMTVGDILQAGVIA